DGVAYTVQRTYDALDRLTKVTYPDNQVVYYAYNKAGSIEKAYTKDASGKVNYYIKNIDYSPTGQLTKIEYGNGAETNYTYDPATLRLTNLTTDSSQGRIQDLGYEFDSQGNVKTLTDRINTASQSFLYDDIGRLIQAQGSYGSLSYEYDSIGNMTYKEGTRLVYGEGLSPQGTVLKPHAVTKYGNTVINYDANGNLSKKGSLELTYDLENRLTKVTDPAPQRNLTLALKRGYNFICFPVIPADPKISVVLASIKGKYSQVSRYNAVTKKYEHYTGNPATDAFSTFEYGRGYRINITSSTDVTLKITGTLPVTQQSVLLKTGSNLIFHPKFAAIAVEQALKPLKLDLDYYKVLCYDKAQARYLEYSKDKKEFTTLEPGVGYWLYCLKDTVWNIAYSQPTTTFAYDGDGGRVKKTTSFDSTTYIGSLYEVTGSLKTKFIFAGSNRICAVDSSGNSSYYHSDHLGSSNVTTDKTGKALSLLEYRPYGTLSKATGTSYPKHRFTGKELDSSTGLYFYGARYYDPQLGRFISADTIVQSPYDPQSLNRYSYCRNNPINYVDPTGNWWFIPFIIAAIKGAIVGAVIGAAVAAVTGQNILQGMLTGAISGAIFGGVGSLGLKGLAQTAAHMVAGAASGAATGAVTGGDIGMNALIGGLSAGVSQWMGSNVSFLAPVAGRGVGVYINNVIRRAFIGSVIGGATSAAMGGSFGYGAAQGAKTSAIAYTANEAMHAAEEGVKQASKALNNQQNTGPTKDLNNKPQRDPSAENLKSNQSDDTKSKGVNWKTVGIGAGTTVLGAGATVAGLVAGTAATAATGGSGLGLSIYGAGAAVTTGITFIAVGIGDIVNGFSGGESMLQDYIKAYYSADSSNAVNPF
ncbi:MAG: RHS repeat-associated core domain-containing protein, partial [Candidatus Omnitrophota bacterium]